MVAESTCQLLRSILLKIGSGLQRRSRCFSEFRCLLFTSGDIRESGRRAIVLVAICAISPKMFKTGLKIKRERWGIPKTCGLVRKPGRTARPPLYGMPAGAREGAG